MALIELLFQLSVEISKHQRDQQVFDNIRTAMNVQQLDALLTIHDFIYSYPSHIKHSEISNAIGVNMNSAYPRIAGLVAMSYLGNVAQVVVIDAILRENVPIIQLQMIKELAMLKHDWFLDILLTLSKLDDPFIAPLAKRFLLDEPFYLELMRRRTSG